MDIMSFLKLVRRRMIVVVLITLLTVAGVTLAGYGYVKGGKDATIFLSINVANIPFSNSLSTSYDDVQAADLFTETIQGWFKNPAFLEKIAYPDSRKIVLNAQKQEKQNLLITYGSAGQQEAEKTAAEIKKALEREITAFNETSPTAFQIALYSVNIEDSGSKLPLLVVLGLFIGLLMGFIFSYLYEYLFGLVKSRTEITGILEKSPDEVLRGSGINPSKLSFLAAFLSRESHKKNIAIYISRKPAEILKPLSTLLPKTKFEEIIFPAKALELIDSRKELQIVFVGLGRTKIADLARIKRLLNEEYSLVIIE